MARGRTLSKLLNDLRAECGLSLNPAHNAGQRDVQVHQLQRMQEWLYEDFAWPHLRVERAIELQVGQRRYSLPPDLNLERIEQIQYRANGVWCRLAAGIDPAQFAVFDSDAGQTSWPVQRWRIWEDDQIELWPVPDRAFDPATLEGALKVVGTRKLKPLVDDNDTADLDDRLLVLYVSAEVLAAAGSKTAALKLQQAQRLYDTFRADLTPRRVIRMFGEARPDKGLRGPPPVHYRTTEVPGPPLPAGPVTVVVDGGSEG